MSKEHRYLVEVKWTGNRGTGTSGYKSYDRSHVVKIDNKMDIDGSSDTAFNGDMTKHNPEDMLVASLSTCHMLWYLHLCADAGIIVVDYRDKATGIMNEDPGGGGHFVSVTLNPSVTVSDSSMIDRANALHEQANKKCFIANSCNFPVMHNPHCVVLQVN
jgi:organic hydroperoxide reductase OsmC/OhrA